MLTNARSRMVVFGLIGLILILNVMSAFGAGAYSHYYIGKRAGEALMEDPNAPADLRDALKDPDVLNAFASGAVSPDLTSLDALGHYNKTTAVPTKMILTAKENLAQASSLPDSDPNKPAKIKEAQKEIAFSYGWLSHCAADLNVHPEVNKITADAFTHLPLLGKGVHAGQEVQLDYYINETLREEGEKIDFIVPYKFVAGCTGKPELALYLSTAWLRTKMMGEVVGMDKIIDVDMNILEERWGKLIRRALAESTEFVDNPDKFKDWDLDAGRMTTEEFESLRTAFIEENGGKIPENWGRRYVEWYNKLRGLTGEKLRAAIRKLLENPDAAIDEQPDETPPPPPPPPAQPGTKTYIIESSVMRMNMKLFVNEQELPEGGKLTITTDVDKPIIFRAMVYDYRRNFCLTEKFKPGEKVEMFSRTPYLYHYKLYKETYTWEPTWRVTKETYKWEINKELPQGKAKSSGAYPTVEKDAYEWTIPTPVAERDSGLGSYSIYVNGEINWKRTAADSSDSWPESATGIGSFLIKPAQ